MKIIARLAVVLATALLSSGCATGVHPTFAVVTANVVPETPAAPSGDAKRRLRVCLSEGVLATVTAPYPFTDRADPSPDVKDASGPAVHALPDSDLTRDDKPVKFAMAFARTCPADRDPAGTAALPVFEAKQGTWFTLPDGIKEGLVIKTVDHYTSLAYVSRSPVFGGHHSVIIDLDEAGTPKAAEGHFNLVSHLPGPLQLLVVAVVFSIAMH